jgi:ABC-type lipoprotein release transport system permease subunit
MQVVLIILSVGLLGVIIFFAVSPKSSRIVRLAAIAAMVLIGISLGIASIIIVLKIRDKARQDSLPIFVDPQRAPPTSRADFVEIIVFLSILVVVIGLIVFMSHIDRKRRLLEEAKKPASSYSSAAKTAEEPKAEESHDKSKEDEFSLDID